MKKLIILFLLLISTAPVKAQLWSASVGYSYSFNNVKDFKHNIEIGMHLYNVYLGYGSNMKYVGENRYGSGGVSDDYRNETIALGYSFKIKETKKNNTIYITPLFGAFIESRLYNDKYYDSDVASKKGKVHAGCMLNYAINRTVLLSLKCTTHNAGFMIGWCF